MVSEKFWNDVKQGNLFLLCPNCNWRDAINQMGNYKARQEAFRVVSKILPYLLLYNIFSGKG